MLLPDVGCFRAKALMASNQAVDSSKVMALPGRGSGRSRIPGALHAHSRCHVPAFLALEKFPVWLPLPQRWELIWGHQCMAKPPLQAGLMVWDPGKGSAGHALEEEHHGAQSQPDTVSSGYIHPGSSHPLWTQPAPQLPASPFGDTQGPVGLTWCMG